MLVLCLSCVQSQPSGRAPPGPPSPPGNVAGAPPRDGPGPPPTDGQGKGQRLFDARGLAPQDSQGTQPFAGPQGGPPQPFGGPKGGPGGPGPHPFDGPIGGSAAAQAPPQSAASGQQSTNPWKDLLTKMMDLLSTGMGPKNLSKVPAEIIDPKQGPRMGPNVNPVPNDLPPPPPPKPLNIAKQGPVTKDCFWEGRYYSPGSDIIRGQHDRWCYVTYCDSQGKIQFWDDYNCKPNSMRDTSSHSSGRERWVPPGQRTPGGSPGKTQGCNHAGQWYEPNQDISSHRVGDRCYGSYCSRDSQVINWEDWCTNVNNVGATPSPGQSQQQGGQGQMQSHAQGQGRSTGRQQVQGQGRGQGGRRRKPPSMGCYHGGKQYSPNEDVVSGTIGDLCYGYYCEGDNVFVHWEDSCQHQNIAPVAPATQPPPIPQTTSWFGF